MKQRIITVPVSAIFDELIREINAGRRIVSVVPHHKWVGRWELCGYIIVEEQNEEQPEAR